MITFLCGCKNEPEVGLPVFIGPPFLGSAYIDRDIINSTDPTSFESLTPLGQGIREMYDRRVNDWITVNAFLFEATYDDGLSIEVQVNPEFETSELSEVQAEKYALEIGKIPKTLRLGVETVWIHKGNELFGGGNNNILIHVEQAENVQSNGYLEEVLVHEAAHSSLDAIHASSTGWLDAQQKDPTFISTYARDHPNREDIAETVLPYLAITFRSDRISENLRIKIISAIPNRIAYLDGLAWNMHPWD